MAGLRYRGDFSNLVSLVGSSSSNLALLTGSKLGQVTVVITLPVVGTKGLAEATFITEISRIGR